MKICAISNKVFETIDITRKKYKTLNNLVTQLKLIFIDIAILERENISEDQHNLIGLLVMLYVFCEKWDEVKFLQEIELPIDFYWQDGLLLEIIVIKFPLSVIKEIIEGDNHNVILLAIHFNEQILLYWALRYNKFAIAIYLIKNHSFDIYKAIYNLVKLQLTDDYEQYEKCQIFLDDFPKFIKLLETCYNKDSEKITKDLWMYSKNEKEVTLDICMNWVKTNFLHYFAYELDHTRFYTCTCNCDECRENKDFLKNIEKIDGPPRPVTDAERESWQHLDVD